MTQIASFESLTRPSTHDFTGLPTGPGAEPALLLAEAHDDRPRARLRPRAQIRGLRAQVDALLPDPTTIDPDDVPRSSLWSDEKTFMREGPETVPDWQAAVDRLRVRPDDETFHQRMERLSHLGDLLRMHPEHVREAIALQEEALELARKLGDEGARGSIELRLAVALQYDGRHPAALRHYARADTIIRIARLRMVRDRVEFQRGTCLAELGNRDGARAAFEEALSLLTRRKTPQPMKVARAEAALEAIEIWTPPPRGQR